MKKILFITGFIFINILSFAQKNMVAGETKETIKQDPDQVFTIVEQMPSFPGGTEAMMKYIRDVLVYPKADRDNGVSGSCYITFVVEKDGSISNVRVLRGISGAQACNEEAIRIVNTMPKWIPGKQNGVLVRVQYNIPVKFTLQ